MTLYAIGDVHGRPDELERTLDLIAEDARHLGIRRPRTVFLGDYVDRGPDSRGVLDIMVSDKLASAVDPVWLLGNHDAALLAVISLGDDPMDWLDLGGADCVESYGVVIGGKPPPIFMNEFLDAFPTAHLQFLSKLHTYYRTGGLLFTHAGLDPFAPVEDTKAQRTGMIWGHHKFPDHQGDYGVRVVHGHWRTDDVVIRPNRIGIDTGCGFPGGRLAAVALDGDTVRVLT
jgi:serine/threonine protein phosphatase 1